ncbi:MAG: hypothetical protein H0U49_12440 [Parachlamydiaceae bacterium]|nr:hypothetical protein [Parachlamydiaceae bacterium]
MWLLALIPFCLQALAIGFDEIYFHLRRGLPKWERIGHPLDTFSLLICFIFILWMPFDSHTVKIYIGLSIFSCLMVTKDEFIHKEHCPGAENWLHAFLFLLHPITLAVAGMIWPISQGVEVTPWMMAWLDNSEALKLFLVMQTAAIALFFSYQLIYWNFIWKNRPVIKY